MPCTCLQFPRPRLLGSSVNTRTTGAATSIYASFFSQHTAFRNAAAGRTRHSAYSSSSADEEASAIAAFFSGEVQNALPSTPTVGNPLKTTNRAPRLRLGLVPARLGLLVTRFSGAGRVRRRSKHKRGGLTQPPPRAPKPR